MKTKGVILTGASFIVGIAEAIAFIIWEKLKEVVLNSGYRQNMNCLKQWAWFSLHRC
jgi:hypothetical protein